MKTHIKWLFLILLVILIGGSIIGAGVLIWEKSQRSGGIPLDKDKVKKLQKSLEENPKSIFIFDPDTSYRLKPSFRGLRHDSNTLPHTTNSLGILGKEEVNPDPSVQKILFLGDSVAYGEHVPYEEIFISRLQELVGPAYQLLNAGCPGWSTHQELAAYRRYYSELDVEKVVLIFTLNDLLRFEWVWRNDNSFQMSEELRGLGGLAHSKLTGRSLRKIRDRFWNSPGLRPLTNLNNTCLNAYLPNQWVDWCNQIQPAIRKITEKKCLIFVIVPARPQLEALNLGSDPATVLFPQRKLQYFCSENGIECIDLLGAFSLETGSYDTSIFIHGGYGLLHLSPEGHNRVAEYLLPIIFPGKK